MAVAQLFPSVYKALGLIPSITKIGEKKKWIVTFKKQNTTK